MAELLSKAFYADDLLTGESSVSKAFKIYERSKEIMAKGGFNLKKWSSSSSEVLEKIEQVESKRETEHVVSREDDESYAKSTTSQGTAMSSNIVKLPGVRWNTSTDTIFFDFVELQNYANSLPITKRSLLSLVAKIFDPLRLISPFTVTLKILFQIACFDKVDWDQELVGERKLKFLALRSEIIQLNSIRIPGYYFCKDTNTITVELHGFSDASKNAYAAVMYFRSIYSDGRVQITLVTAKTRVAPTKQQSILRLELIGALILARSTRKIRDIIGEVDTTYWVDSTVALCWIKNDRCWKQYIRNRVAEIRSLTLKDSWRFCPGTENPADLPARRLEAKELATSETWWRGPDFLHHSPATWPSDMTAQEHLGDK
ncbi:uncharacterized protein LOC114538580 [Dendronephthya gigantea]|uniref:uncharacterized protein LOC114538580 n=1 Tax=Dendronephthya gigantea TaxID=151771 RepID=UPI00106D14A3|nr:uncharacterized protein LOC114538580 [Dendronephthya gigantea]